jgi:hypothetical protein
MVDAMEGVVTEKQQPDPTASAVAGTELRPTSTQS